MFPWSIRCFTNIDQQRITPLAQERQQTALVANVWVLIAPHNDPCTAPCAFRADDPVPHIPDVIAPLNWDVVPFLVWNFKRCEAQIRIM